MSVHVLTTGYWPTYPPMDVRLPHELNVYQECLTWGKNFELRLRSCETQLRPWSNCGSRTFELEDLSSMLKNVAKISIAEDIEIFLNITTRKRKGDTEKNGKQKERAP